MTCGLRRQRSASCGKGKRAYGSCVSDQILVVNVGLMSWAVWALLQRDFPASSQASMPHAGRAIHQSTRWDTASHRSIHWAYSACTVFDFSTCETIHKSPVLHVPRLSCVHVRYTSQSLHTPCLDVQGAMLVHMLETHDSHTIGLPLPPRPPRSASSSPSPSLLPLPYLRS